MPTCCLMCAPSSRQDRPMPYYCRKRSTMIAIRFGMAAIMGACLLVVTTISSENTYTGTWPGTWAGALPPGTSSKIRASSSYISDNAAFLEDIPYSQLIDAVIELYHASDPETTSKSEKFDEALRAMKKVEFDGLPIPITGVDGLYVGSLGAAYNLKALQQEGITHVVSLDRGAPCHFPTMQECVHIDYIWDDGKPKHNITQTFDVTLPFIRSALTKEGGRVLVHCWNGESRSVSTIVAYMIKYLDMKPKTALKQIQTTRTQAQPRKEYMKELDAFYTKRHRHQKH